MEFKPKNSTTARKGGNDMKKAPAEGSKRLGWQNTTPDGYSVDATPFGPLSDSASTYKANSKYVGNQHTGHSNETDNFGQKQMPNRKGNIADQTARTRRAPVTAGASANPVAEGGRKWMPSKEQNYVGNADKIQERQGFNSVGNKD